jgi:pyrrolidone-carboxylate peptidase
MTVEEWAPRLAAELGLDTEIDIDTILGIAGDVAHAVERKAAPVSAFVIGLAAGRAGGTPEAVARAVAVTRALAAEAAEDGEDGRE